MIHKIKYKFKRFRLQQTSNKERNNKVFFDNIHIISTSIQS